MSKTHYRKVFKSDHLGVADLEDFKEEKRPLIFTITQVKQEIGVMVAGRKGNHNIAYFAEGIKPMVLNSTNSKIVKSFCKDSPWVEDWKNVRVKLYIDPNVKMKGEVVGGLRIHTVQPEDNKPQPKPAFTEKMFKAANDVGATVETIKATRTITPEIAKKYKEYVQKNK